MLLDIIAWLSLQGGQWEGVCCLADQVSFGRSSESSYFSIPFSKAFRGKVGSSSLGTSAQLSSNGEIGCKDSNGVEGLNHNLHRAGANELFY